MSPTGRVPRPRARVTFGRSPKSDQKRCLKPQVSRLPARLGYVKNLSPRTPRKPKCCTSSYNESLTILLSLPLLQSKMGARGPTDFGDYQIAHMPPLAACAGAARWAAKYKEYALLRSVFCRTACQHAAAKPINQRIAARNTGAAAGRDVQAIRCTTISIYFGFRGVRGHIFRHGQARRKS